MIDLVKIIKSNSNHKPQKLVSEPPISHYIQDLTLLNQSQLSNSITNKNIHIFKKVLQFFKLFFVEIFN